MVRVGTHWNALDVQQPPPLRMQRMLHTGCVQFGSWYKRPASGVPLDVKERINGLRSLQVVNIAMLEKRSSCIVCLRRLTFVVSVLRQAGLNRQAG